MRWDELDFDKHVWTLPASRTKNGKAHIVHLSDEAVKVIRMQPQRSAFVFDRAGKPFNGFSAAEVELDKAAGVTGWRLHDLRRTAVSGMARLGVAPHVADKILNRSSGAISGVAAVYQRHEFLSEQGCPRPLGQARQAGRAQLAPCCPDAVTALAISTDRKKRPMLRG